MASCYDLYTGSGGHAVGLGSDGPQLTPVVSILGLPDSFY